MSKHHSEFAGAEPRAARYEIADDAVAGLRLVVQPSGHRSWAVRYTFAGKDRKYTIGDFSRTPLAKARELGAKVLLKVAAGEDPQGAKVQQRREAQDATAFGAAYDRYLERYAERELRPGTLKDIKSVFNRVLLPKFRRRPLPEITRLEVKNVVDKCSDPRRTFMVCRAFLNWCVAELLLPVSPMTGLKPPSAPAARDRVLSSEEIRAVWWAADAMGYPFGHIVKLLILTGARREEIAALRRAEVKDRYAIIPAPRTKNGREHRIYLADASLAVLESVPLIRNKAGFYFTQTGKTSVSGFSKAKARIDELTADTIAEPWTLHDLRRTTATGMASIGVSLHVAEKILNHVSGSFSGIVSVYQRHEYADEKRDAWTKWATRLLEIVGSGPDTRT